MSDKSKILIVEDDSDFREFLEKLLSLKDFQVYAFGRGYDALKYLNRNPVDLVLLDLQLPDVDGYWIIDQLNRQFSDLLVIVMTGYASVDSAVKTLKKGAYDYLEKPFATEKLLKTIQNALDRKRLETQSQKNMVKLGESEEKYHQLFDNVTDALMIFDAETRKFEDANAAALSLFGYCLEEICDLRVEELSAEKDKTLKHVEGFKKGEQASNFVPRRFLRKKDGSIFPGEISASTFLSGGRQKIIESIRDVTEREQILEELHAAKKRLQHVLSSSPAVIYTADPAADFATTFISDNVKTQLGYEPEEYTADPEFWFDRIHPDDAPHMMNWVSNLVDKGWQVSEYRFRHKDGSYRWLHDELRLLYDAQGVPYEVVGSSIDITARRKAEKDLQESKERFRNLVENSLVGIAIIQDDKFVYQNHIQDQLYGPVGDQTIFQAYQYLHPDDLEKVKKAYAEVSSGKSKTIEVDFRFYPSGKIGNRTDLRWVQCRATTFNYRGKEAILANSADVTEAKQLEHQLIIKNKMLSLGRVAAGIAHEIKNPFAMLFWHPGAGVGYADTYGIVFGIRLNFNFLCSVTIFQSPGRIGDQIQHDLFD